MITFYSGRSNYKKHTLENNRFTTELVDVDLMGLSNIHDIFAEHLQARQSRTVEVLYSGGLDSEAVLASCVKSHIPVRAVTMRLMVNGYPINTSDLYYSERFCRTHGVHQQLVDLSVDSFFENGDYIRYLEPYGITEPHVATHFWLFEQCQGFPVLGGEYSWPWHHRPVLSPHRHVYSMYDRFLRSRGILGIGNMLGHSLDSNLAFVKNHLEIYNPQQHDGNDLRIPHLKVDLFRHMGLGDFELRLKSYGWEGVSKGVFNLALYREHLLKTFGAKTNVIAWGEKVGAVIGADPGSNDLHR